MARPSARADYAAAHGVTYVNHTFTSHLALSASLQPLAGLPNDKICEYPVAPKQLAIDLTSNRIDRTRQARLSSPTRQDLESKSAKRR